MLTGQPPRRIPPEVLAAVAKLARQGNNLNQLARIANTKKSTLPVAVRLDKLLKFYEELAGRIRRNFQNDRTNDR